MVVHYNKRTDTIRIVLQSAQGNAKEYQTGDFVVLLDENNELAEFSIQRPKEFLAFALEAGVPLPASSVQAKVEQKPTWEDVDSSMISAFKYDEASRELEVIFHRTGVYSYFDVPPKVVEGLREASSKGSYMRWAIIDRFHSAKGKR